MGSGRRNGPAAGLRDVQSGLGLRLGLAPVAHPLGLSDLTERSGFTNKSLEQGLQLNHQSSAWALTWIDSG